MINKMDIMELGQVLSQSGYFQDARQAAQAVVKVLAGSELGFGPIASMTGINIIKGRVTLSANLIASAIKRSGRYNYRIKQLDDTVCEVIFFENGQEVGLSSFSIEDAKNAVLNGDNWRKYPRNMLFARAISNGAKWYCPDIFGSPIYTPDELGADVDGETGEIILETKLPMEDYKHWSLIDKNRRGIEKLLAKNGISLEILFKACDVLDWNDMVNFDGSGQDAFNRAKRAKAAVLGPGPEKQKPAQLLLFEPGYARPASPEELNRKFRNFRHKAEKVGFYMDKEERKCFPARLHEYGDNAPRYAVERMKQVIILLGRNEEESNHFCREILKYFFLVEKADYLSAIEMEMIFLWLFGKSDGLEWNTPISDNTIEELKRLIDKLDDIPF